MSNLYTKNFDNIDMDNLFAGSSVPVLTGAVTLKAGQGIVKRGTVLGIITATSLAVAVDSTKSDGSQVANCILTDDVDTTDADTVATVYVSGHFNRKALIFGGTDTAPKHEIKLRELGIFLKDNIAY
jgi:Bacteriophage lambda head decoration protein D